MKRTSDISIHALREESDGDAAKFTKLLDIFQSTLSVRRATRGVHNIRNPPIAFQSTLSVRRATSLLALHLYQQPFQSTLSVRRATERDGTGRRSLGFQSTLSVRRATVQLDIFVRFLRRKPAA